MKKTDKIAYKQKSREELVKLLTDLKKKLIESKSKQYLGNQKDTSVFKKIHSEIALVSTLINQNDR
ncbi:MAG: 50S ribosomal protein L29 [Candidatus Shapirobacteria bacterium]|jgi:ribosomal protein L29